ncbi:MAG: 7-cyano-7-deazaguanine synthase [Sulfolobales archaeon]
MRYRVELVGDIERRVRRYIEGCFNTDPMGMVVVLASGGLDSAVLLKLLDLMGYRIVVVTINTRSRAPRERMALRDIVSEIKNVVAFHELEAPDLKEYVEIVGEGYRGYIRREPYYIPARNVIFLGYAAYIAEIYGARVIATAHNKGDSSVLPDASEEFISRVSDILSTYIPGLRICMPLSILDKVEIAILGISIGAPIDKSWSCYDNLDKPCGRCRGCVERERALEAARKILQLPMSRPEKGA